MDLFWILFTVMAISALSCFILSELTLNYSQVDKLWSLMPLVYSIISLSMFPSPRLWLMTLLVTIWGFRLSYNFHRKGGYSIIPWKGEEDYRWSYMRQNPFLKGRIRFGIFNLLFISFYQHFLILLFSSPLIIAAQNNLTAVNLIDFAAAVMMIFFLSIETIADNQLFRFHTYKKGIKDPGGKYSISLKEGFMSEGLWKFSRHPNFISEQGIWISFYFFGVAASGKWLNPSLTGPVLLVFLFAASTVLTEKISGSKYAGYENYKKKVPKYFPRFGLKERIMKLIR